MSFFSQLFGGGKKESPAPLPPAPDTKKIEQDERKKQLAALSNRTQTTFTSPLGATGSANTERKQLLGQ